MTHKSTRAKILRELARAADAICSSEESALCLGLIVVETKWRTDEQEGEMDEEGQVVVAAVLGMGEAMDQDEEAEWEKMEREVLVWPM